MSKQDSSISFGVGMLMGIVGGVIAAILYAPKSGEETRKDVENVITDLAQKYTPEISEAKRICDFLNGVTFALNGKVEKIAKLVYMFTPNN